MTNRRRIEDRIAKKQQEIQELDMRIREARAYIQALQDVVKIMPKEGDEPVARETESSMRPGSYVSDARDAILKVGHPLHVVEIIKMSGRKVDRKTKIGMSSSLAAYVRRDEIFTRPRPNTFGLLELNTEQQSKTPSTPSVRQSPPINFGLDTSEEEANH